MLRNISQEIPRSVSCVLSNGLCKKTSVPNSHQYKRSTYPNTQKASGQSFCSSVCRILVLLGAYQTSLSTRQERGYTLCYSKGVFVLPCIVVYLSFTTSLIYKDYHLPTPVSLNTFFSMPCYVLLPLGYLLYVLSHVQVYLPNT